MTTRTPESVVEGIKEKPLDHVHVDISSLRECATIDGVLDMLVVDAHSRYAPLGWGREGPCDVLKGPCSCGDMH